MGVVRCEDAAPAVASLADGLEPARPAQAAHVGSCLRCQAEVLRDRRMSRALADLRDEVLQPDPELLGAVLDAVDEFVERRAALRARLAYLLGGAAATAGTIAVMLVRRGRGEALAS